MSRNNLVGLLMKESLKNTSRMWGELHEIQAVEITFYKMKEAFEHVCCFDRQARGPMAI